jgi:hypothetical protein
MMSWKAFIQYIKCIDIGIDIDVLAVNNFHTLPSPLILYVVWRPCRVTMNIFVVNALDVILVECYNKPLLAIMSSYTELGCIQR